MSYNFGIENKLIIQERNKKKREKRKEKKTHDEKSIIKPYLSRNLYWQF